MCTLICYDQMKWTVWWFLFTFLLPHFFSSPTISYKTTALIIPSRCFYSTVNEFYWVFSPTFLPITFCFYGNSSELCLIFSFYRFSTGLDFISFTLFFQLLHIFYTIVFNEKWSFYQLNLFSSFLVNHFDNQFGSWLTWIKFYKRFRQSDTNFTFWT